MARPRKHGTPSPAGGRGRGRGRERRPRGAAEGPWGGTPGDQRRRSMDGDSVDGGWRQPECFWQIFREELSVRWEGLIAKGRTTLDMVSMDGIS